MFGNKEGASVEPLVYDAWVYSNELRRRVFFHGPSRDELMRARPGDEFTITISKILEEVEVQ